MEQVDFKLEMETPAQMVVGQDNPVKIRLTPIPAGSIAKPYSYGQDYDVLSTEYWKGQKRAFELLLIGAGQGTSGKKDLSVYVELDPNDATTTHEFTLNRRPTELSGPCVFYLEALHNGEELGSILKEGVPIVRAVPQAAEGHAEGLKRAGGERSM